MDNERDRNPLAPLWTDLIDAINALLIYRNGIIKSRWVPCTVL